MRSVPTLRTTVTVLARDWRSSELDVLLSIAHIQACTVWARHECFGARNCSGLAMPLPPRLPVFAVTSLSTSGETLTIEESMTLRARTENAGHVGVEHEWSWAGG